METELAFRGLFIGIDRYASAAINWLSCANRDATALHALFTDTLGGETTLLTDEQATIAAVEEQFAKLATCSPDDVVVIAFSGHGTETHELVGYDSDPYDLARTTIPLTMLGEWCSRIPVVRKNLIRITPPSSRVDIRDEAHPRSTSS
jgi:helicase